MDWCVPFANLVQMEIVDLQHLPNNDFCYGRLVYGANDRSDVRGHRSDHISPNHRHLDYVLVGSVQMVLHVAVPSKICKAQNKIVRNSGARIGSVRSPISRFVYDQLFKADTKSDFRILDEWHNSREFHNNEPLVDLSKRVIIKTSRSGEPITTSSLYCNIFIPAVIGPILNIITTQEAIH